MTQQVGRRVPLRYDGAVNRTVPALALALLAACATIPDPPPVHESVLPAGLATRLSRVRCLVVAPLENASDEPLVAEAATGALAAALDWERVRIFPIGELRSLFEGTPLELPEGVSEPVAVELGELLGADAVLYGTLAGHARGAGREVTLTVRLAAAGGRETLFLRSVRVVPGAGEPFVEASRRAALEAAQTMLEQLGGSGPRACFDKARLDRVKQLARRSVPSPAARTGAAATAPAALPSTTAPASPPPGPNPAAQARRRPSLSVRQETWAAKLAARERFVLEDVAFVGRSPMFEKQSGFSDLVLALAATPGARICIEGFVDTGPSQKEDLRLSMELARTAGRRLIDLGVPRDRVTWAGRGHEEPISPGFSAKGRQANRRVEVVVVQGAR
jgi:outer membrane protein OmpA-like peptidoglycan-associated protein